MNRANIVIALLQGDYVELFCLGVNGDPSSKHPLYVAYNVPFSPFAP
jgi:hypothetical protein